MIAQIFKDIPHEIKQVSAKKTLLSAGEIASKIFVVKSGCVRSWFNADGKDITLQFFMPGQPVASFESLVNMSPSEYSIETILPSEIVVINGLDFKNWIESHPEILEQIPQHYIASYLGITPVSLSRIRSRYLQKK